MNADVEALLIPWLASTLTVRAVTDLPADDPPGSFLAGLPYVQVTRIGGADDDNLSSFDAPTVDVDCYAADRESVSALAARVHDALRVTLPGLTLAGATVTKVQTITGPSWRPYDNTSLRRFGATYRIRIRS